MFFIGILTLVYIVSLFVDREKRKLDQNKKPLVVTSRIKRLIITIALLYLIPSIAYFINNGYRNRVLLSLAMMTSLNYIVVYIANLINHPMERIIYHKYEHNAKKKLESMSGLKVIGITGSYGKTSCKNILNDVLNVKMNCLATPKSLNTFNGLMITVNNQLSKFDDAFIAEMGAYVKGEINRLCKLVNPKYGIITTIGTAHLETFGSEQNIIDGKMELIEYLPSDGIGILNKDDVKQKNYKIKNPNPAKIVWIGIDSKNVDVKAENIKCSSKGTEFEIIFKGDNKKYKFETKLLGKHNVYNILAAVALGYEFGLTIKELQQGVKKVRPVEHRLEVKKLGKFYQIDDAYNSNPIGAKSALEVLNSVDGYKIVVTPGMIELGNKEYELNREFGKQIADVADYVILIGEKQTKPILEGLTKEKFDKDKIKVLNDVRESYKLIATIDKKNIYALYENDLPDTYNE
jgi:UDP-N-acetylmuramoyl-tripeptide--D-alanyl-D-alanine ligase